MKSASSTDTTNIGNWLLCFYCCCVCVASFFEHTLGPAGWFLLALVALEDK